jgi:hypothetical protein
MPKFIFSFEGFMKYWYEVLQVKHPIQLNTISSKMSYYMIVFTMDYLLRISFIYKFISFLFFYMQNNLFLKANAVKEYVDKYYPDFKYQLKFNEDNYKVDNIYYKSNV